MRILFCLVLSMLSGCVAYHETAAGGIRVEDSRDFKYNRDKYRQHRPGLLDTAAVYVQIKYFDRYWTPGPEFFQKTEYMRFFGGGQVLFFSCDSTRSKDLLNNPDAGKPGYYTILGSKIKIDKFSSANGGQTLKYFGRVQEDGNLIFYQDATMYNSFYLTEKSLQNTRYTIWKKIKYSELLLYRPNW